VVIVAAKKIAALYLMTSAESGVIPVNRFTRKTFVLLGLFDRI
jgi:hypothetical protein